MIRLLMSLRFLYPKVEFWREKNLHEQDCDGCDSINGEHDSYERMIYNYGYEQSYDSIRDMNHAARRGLIRVSSKYDWFVHDCTQSHFAPFLEHQEAMSKYPEIDPQIPRCHITKQLGSQILTSIRQFVFVEFDDNEPYVLDVFSWVKEILPGARKVRYIRFQDQDCGFIGRIRRAAAEARLEKELSAMKGLQLDWIEERKEFEIPKDGRTQPIGKYCSRECWVVAAADNPGQCLYHHR